MFKSNMFYKADKATRILMVGKRAAKLHQRKKIHYQTSQYISGCLNS